MSFKTQLRIAASLPALFGLVVAGALWVSLAQVDRTRARAAQAESIVRDLSELNALTQEYLLFGGARVSDRLAKSQVSLAAVLAAADFAPPAEQALLQSLRRGQRDLERLQTVLLSGSAVSREQVAGALLVKVQDLRFKARRLAALQNREVVAIQRQVDALVLIALGALTVLSIALLTWVSRRLIRGLDRLALGMRRVEHGELTHEIPVGRGDELDRLAVVFNDMTRRLLNNALKFSRHRESAVIEVAGRREAGAVVYTVGDNGVGFEPAYAAKLFGLFQRLHGMDEFEGTGVVDFQPDLILADYHLPTLDGWRALALCRERLPTVPFIFVTGAMGEELAVESIKQGATDYILKDRLARLPAAVQRALEERRVIAQRALAQAALGASEEHIRRLNRTLRTISACNQDLVRACSEDDLLQAVCRDLVEVGQHLLVRICYPDGDRAEVLRTVAARGDDAALSAADRDPVQDSLAQAAMAQGRTLTSSVPGSTAPRAASADQSTGTATSVALPLIYEQQVLGVLSVWSSAADAFDREELRLLEELAADLAYGIVAVRTVVERNRYMTQVGQAMRGTVTALSRTVEMRDPYTAGHQQRVAALAVAVARAMGAPDRVIEGLYFGGMIHDIGKIAVPAEILNKPTKLTSIEYQLIQQHSQAGYRIVAGIEFPWPLAEMIVQHHERVDGSGYPQGLRGEAMLLESRILAVADVVEAMSSHRPYRAALGMETAIAEIEAGQGSRYDPLVVDACIRVIRAGGMCLPEQAAVPV